MDATTMVAEADERERRIAGIVSRALRSLDRTEEGAARKVTVEKVRGWLNKIAEAC